MDEWIDQLTNKHQTSRLVELSKIKCLLEVYYFNDTLSLLCLSVCLSLCVCLSLSLSFSLSLSLSLSLSSLSLSFSLSQFRVIDVGSEWRTFSNEKSATDRSRVGAAEVL